MLIFKRSRFVIFLVFLNLIFTDCTVTKINKLPPSSQTYISPGKKLHSNNAFVMGRTNQQETNSPNSQLINEHSLRANLTNENLQLNNMPNNKVNEEMMPLHESQSGNFTTDDVQKAVTNDKLIDANLTLNSNIKPFEDSLADKESTNKNVANSPSHYSNSNLNNNSPFLNIPSQVLNNLNNAAGINPLNAGLYNNQNQISQIDTFNNENLDYTNIGYQCVLCNTQMAHFGTNDLSKCCELGYNDCCTKSSNNQINQNLINQKDSNNNVQNNRRDLNGNQINKPNFIQSNVNSVSNSVPNSVSNSVSDSVSNSNANSILNSKNIPSSPSSNAELYGTKTKSYTKPIVSKELQESADENLDTRNTIPSYNSANLNPTIYGINPTSFYGYNPSLSNSYFQVNKDKFLYTNGLNNNNFLTGLPVNFLYSGLNNLNNLAPNFYSNLNSNSLSPINSNQITPLNANSMVQKNSQINPVADSYVDTISRKTSNSNRFATKTVGKLPTNNANLINDNSINQPVAVDQIKQSTNLAQSQTTNQQRTNNRNPNQNNQQSQGGISNAFNSFISHIPFIGFNPINQIPVVLGFSSNSQQQQQQLNNPQIGQIISTGADNQIVGTQNYPYDAVIAIRPQSQNAQLVNPILNANDQLEPKVANNQQNSNQQLTTQQSNNQPLINQPLVNQQPNNQLSTNQQSTNQLTNTGFVSTMFSRPYNLYQRIGGYFTRPSFLGSSKPANFLHYANSPIIPLEFIQSELQNNEQNLQNFGQNLQFYSQFTNANQNLLNPNQNNYETLGQINPFAFYPYMQNEKLPKEQTKSSRRS